ncbi:MAG: hypothetical protein BMS9Abin15_0683 [Gammaproteobacteria bacterium]|nr:MAG: hypothetical protein BMS9Abin15_0683 [Gammaproteobacteria bacterium]
MRLTLATKVALLTTGMVIVVGAAVGIVNYRSIEHTLIERGREELKEGAHHRGAEFIRGLHEAQRDVLLLSGMPPIEGIIRAHSGGGVDPKGGSTEGQWRKRLEKIFVGLLNRNKEYYQLRFIGVEDNGRELVRVTREKGQILSGTTGSLLQQKGHRDYFKRTLKLGPGEVYISELNLQREHGKIIDPVIPTMRFATPIYSGDGALFGMIVINVDFIARLNKLNRPGFEERNVYLTNQRGDYLLQPDRDKTFGFDRGEQWQIQNDHPKVTECLLPGSGCDSRAIDMQYDGGQTILHLVKLNFDPVSEDRFFLLLIAQPLDDILVSASHARNQSIQIIAILVLLGVIIAALYARIAVKPLRRLVESANRIGAGHYDIELPKTGNDEVGTLAKAFKEMIAAVKARETRIHEDEARTRAFMDYAVDAIVTINDKGIMLSVNNAAEKIFGYSADEMVGQNVSMLMPSPVRENHDAYLAKYLKTRRAKVIGIGREVTGLRKNQETFPVYLSVTEVPTEKGYTFTGIMLDLSKQKSMDRALKKANERITSLLNSLTDAFIAVDNQWRIIYANPMAEKFTYQETGDMLGKTIWDLVPELANFAYKPLHHAMVDRQIVSEEVFYTPHNQWYAMRAYPAENEGLIIYLLDITARKQAESESQRLGRILEQSREEIYVFDGRSLKFKQINNGAQANLGYSMDELLQMTPVDIKPEYTEATFRALIRPLHDGTEHLLHFETIHRRKDGSDYPCEVRLQYSANEQPPVYVAIVLDLTKRHETEQSLKSSEARMQHLVVSSPAVIYSADPAGEGMALTFVSDNVLQQLGHPSEVFVKEPEFWQTHVHPDDRARAHIGISKLIDEESNAQEYRFQSKDGGYRWIYDDSKLLELKNGQQEIVGSWLDITERKQAELDLAKKNVALSVLSASNEAMIHAGSEYDLLTEVCSIVVSKGAYHMAWVGYCNWDDAAKAIQPIAQAGMGTEHLQTESLTWADTKEGQHPSSAAIRTGEMQLVTDLANDERFPTLRSQALEAGFSSIIALPLKSDEHCTGVLCIYSSETNAFDADSVRLLTELADDVSFGIVALRTRTERERLRRHNELILNASGEGIMGIDIKGMITSINPSGARMLGWQSEALIGRSLTGDVCIFTEGTLKDNPDDRRPCPFIENHDIHAALYEGVAQRSALNYFAKQDGSHIPVEYVINPVEEAGKITGVVVDFYDITDRIEAEQALRASEERYALATKGANDGMWDWDLVKDEIYLSPRFHEILGYTEGEIGNHAEDVFKLIVDEDLIDFRTAVARHLDGLTDNLAHEFRMKHKDGSERWLKCRGVAVKDDDGKPYRMAGSQTDITERKLAEEQLIHDAFHDGLTNLPNRALLLDRLNVALKLGQRSEKLDFAILFIDLDNFKVVNDSLGHLLGDRMLIEVSKRLMECIRPGDTVTRLGGDEFVILLEGVKDAAGASIVAERFLSKVVIPINLDGHEIFPNASIGIAMANKDYRRSEDILRDADTAMYKAKSLGKGRYEVFNAEMHEGAMMRLHMENDLRRALERNEFKLNYQPIVELETAKPVGFEALLRWIHPEKGFIPPLDFIPVAEETGLIVSIGEWVISEACRQLQAWQAEHAVYDDLYISVNLSPRQFSHPGLLNHIKQSIESAGLASHHLRVEITESAIMEDANHAKQILNKLHKLGVLIYLDDFGTGYSSLSYLHEFPIDVLKIDRSFVISYEKETKAANILKSVITLSRAINLKIVAEGIEEAHNAEWLLSMGCDYGQGYFFSKPLPSDQVQAYVASQLIDADAA